MPGVRPSPVVALHPPWPHPPSMIARTLLLSLATACALAYGALPGPPAGGPGGEGGHNTGHPLPPPLSLPPPHAVASPAAHAPAPPPPLVRPRGLPGFPRPRVLGGGKGE